MPAYIKTYGCTLNQADSELMANLLTNEGIALSESEDDADTVIVNTCTVKTPTQQKILHHIKELEKKHKRVIVTGCMASANQDIIEKYAPEASIVTTSNIDKIAEATLSTSRTVFNAYNRKDKLLFFNSNDSVIAKVPVSEGCLSSCGFCETKFARGPLNSFSEERILNAIEFSAKRGAREVQLTSQDMGAYGLDRKTNIAKLMNKITLINGDFKVRVGMLNPEHLGKYLEEFALALNNRRFYKFVHLPVQSGSNKILKDMKRFYTIEQFDGYVDYIRRVVPEVTIETDIIVGYPTETEEDFEATLNFVRRTRPNVVNMCKFWSRPHAAASKLVQLPNEVISERSATLGRVVRHVQREINEKFVGRNFDAIVTEIEDGSTCARMDSYKKVIIKSDASNLSLGSRVVAAIDSASCNVLYGKSTEAVGPVVI